jgi:hypothetical protein
MRKAQFVNYVQALDKKGLEEKGLKEKRLDVLMLAIFATVKDPQLAGDRTKAFDAAIALYFLAASCLVKKPPQFALGQVIKLPRMSPVVVAIMSVALLGGKQGLASRDNLEPEATHTYHASIDAVAGACESDRMLRAVYAAFFPENQRSMAYGARADVLTPQQKKQLIAEIEVRVKLIRDEGGKDNALTLIVDSIQAYDDAGIGKREIVTPFFIDTEMEDTFLEVTADELLAFLRELIRAIQEAETASPSSSEQTATTSQPTDPVQTEDKRHESTAQFSGAIEAAKAGTPDWKSRVKATLDSVKDATGFLADIPGAITTTTDTWNKAYKAVATALTFLSSFFR